MVLTPAPQAHSVPRTPGASACWGTAPQSGDPYSVGISTTGWPSTRSGPQSVSPSPISRYIYIILSTSHIWE